MVSKSSSQVEKAKEDDKRFPFSGPLIPSTCLSPFGGMNDPFFNFPPSEARWPPGAAMTGMGQMGPQMPPGAGAAANHFSVAPPSLARQAGLGQSFGSGGGGSCGQLPTLPGLGNPHHQHQGPLSHNGALSHAASTASMYPSPASAGPYCEFP